MALTRLVEYAHLTRHSWQARHARDETARAAARQHLVERMGRMHGLPQKLGQMLAFAAADTPAPHATGFSTLHENATALPLAEVQPLLEAAWQRPVRDVVAWIDPQAAAASLGQVFQARLHDGRPVAIKVQYPGIRAAVMADLNMLGWLSIPVGGLQRGFDLAGYQRALVDNLQCELDYRREADWQRKFAAWARRQPALAVPQVVDSLSTEQVLVSHWETGDTWQHVQCNWSPSQRRQLAEGLLDILLQGLFVEGMLHADWHPGNVRFRHGPLGSQVLLYDFGCVYGPSRAERLALLELVQATIDGAADIYPLLVELGFQADYLRPLRHKLPTLCRLLFEPLCTAGPFDMAHWRLGPRVANLLGDDRWNFRIAGPPALVFLLRAWHGVCHYLGGLQVAIDWHKAWRPIIDQLHCELPQRVTGGLGAARAAAPAVQQRAEHLKIRVSESGQTRVQITSPVAAVDHLEATIDVETRRKIADRGNDLPQLVCCIQADGYRPQVVFELKEGARLVRVWLE